VRHPAAGVLLVLLACSAPKTSAPAPAPAGATAGETLPPASSAAAPAAGKTAAGKAAASVPTVPARPFDESVLSGREFLLEARSTPPAVRDPAVGPLARDPALAAAVTAFLDGARGPGPDPALLEPRWADYLRAWAQKNGPGLGAGAGRAGEPLPEKDGVTLVPVVVRGENRTAGGWLALTRGADGGWLVSDAEVSPSDAAPTLFDPEAAVQLISSPSRR